MPATDPNKFYLTTPIYYVNARPHIGHAYTTIVADVLARRRRLLGDDTFFLTGTDEHGQKIARSAAAAGIPPQQFADQVSQSFQNLWIRMGITNDAFIRTTDPRHMQGAQKLFAELYARGQIYLSSYTGQYSIGEEMFVEGPPGTIGPDGRPTETVTEENFFFRLSDYQLPLLNLIESNQLLITPDSARNEVLSFLRGDLEEAIRSAQFAAIWDSSSSDGVSRKEAESLALERGDIKFSTPTKNFPRGVAYVPGALRDLSVSRSSFAWGIPVPDDILRDAGTTQKHVIYVWLDALSNYMTGIGYGSDAPADQASFQHYWPADLHLVGKEITRFHCVYWPAFLLALNPALLHSAQTVSPNDAVILSEASQPHREAESKDPRILPEPPQLSAEQHKSWAEKMLHKQITAHGWLLFDNSKMSKSRGNIVRTETILDAFGALCPPVHVAPTNAPPTGQADNLRTADIRKGTASAIPPSTPNVSGTPSTIPPSTPDVKGTASAVPPATPALKGTGFSPSVLALEQNAALAAEVRPPTQHERDLFAADVLRYFLLREIPFGQDGSFSFDALITRYNADLANGYGNLVSRTLAMIYQNFDGAVPEAQFSAEEIESSSDLPDRAFFGSLSDLGLFTAPDGIILGTYELERYEFLDFLELVMNTITRVDRFFSLVKPWKLAKSDEPNAKRLLGISLWASANAIRVITALLYPILPYATSRVWAQLGLGDIEQAARNGKLNNLQWGGLQPGTKLGPLSPIFPRADKGLAQIMTDMEEQNTLATGNSKLETVTPNPSSEASPNPASTGPGPTPRATEAPQATAENPQPATPQIAIDDFAKIDLRVAQVLVAERIPKADKLLRLEVDLGPELGRRQILSGIAEFYAPEELIGRRIVVIANLAPRKMRGLESHGMLLAASADDPANPGKPILATMAEDIALGSRLR